MTDHASSTANPIRKADRATLQLQGELVMRHDKPALELSCDGERLSEHSFLVEHRLETITSYKLKVQDFEHESHHFVMNAMSILPDGTLKPWERVKGAALSPSVTAQSAHELRFVVVAVCPKTQMAHAEPYPGVLNVTMLTGGSGDDTRDPVRGG